jgi:hypothetical protein
MSQNRVQFGDERLETSSLAINSYSNMLKIDKVGLFNFIETEEDKIQKAIEIIRDKKR